MYIINEASNVMKITQVTVKPSRFTIRIQLNYCESQN